MVMKPEYGDEKGTMYATQYQVFLARSVVVHALKQTDY